MTDMDLCVRHKAHEHNSSYSNGVCHCAPSACHDLASPAHLQVYGDVLDTASFTKGLQNVKLSLTSLLEFVGRVLKLNLASSPPVSAVTMAGGGGGCHSVMEGHMHPMRSSYPVRLDGCLADRGHIVATRADSRREVGGVCSPVIDEDMF